MTDKKKSPRPVSRAGDAIRKRISRIETEWGRGEARILISGADRILHATDEAVVLEADGERLRIFGADIVCLTYEGGIAEIRGRVAGVLFGEADA